MQIGVTKSTTSKWYIGAVLLVLLFGSVLSALSAEAQHGHDRSQPCAVCQLAHAPAIQSPVVLVSAPGGGVAQPLALQLYCVLDGTRVVAGARAPPLLD
jgi:hypothetical protein